ncbi:hypothetical protein AXA59_26000 (plasmid) [Enterobacter hormaechei]|nr:hypothetical protein AXA59_26000 [Enterobacter hormaechei]
MQDILSNTFKVIISFFVALVLNKLLSLFRKRQLYLSCWNSIENTSIADNAFTMNSSIYNNGKDKEKNVIIKMPNGLSCSVLSSTYDYKNENGEILIDRVLPSEKISMVILVEGARKLEKKIRPRIKSEDANGRVYLTQDVVPPSAGVLTFTIALFTTTLGVLSYLISSGDSPEKTIGYIHNSLFYSDYKNNGFLISPFGNDIVIKNYDIAKKEYPIELVDARRLNGKIQYKFRLVNKLSSPMAFKANYKVNSSHAFWGEISNISDFADEQTQQKAKQEIFEKYHANGTVIGGRYFLIRQRLLLSPIA